MLAWIAAAAGLAAQPVLREELEPMRFLVGHCWQGVFERDGARDIHCFETVYDGQHIRDRHEVNGEGAPYRGETIYSWNAKLGRVDFTYWNSLGGVSRGTMAPGPGRLDFGDETYESPDGRRQTFSTQWRRVDERTWDAVVTSAADPTGNRVIRYRRLD
jgi:hypothetical protein